jgi:transposase
VLEDCIAAVEAATARRDHLEAHIEAALPDWSLTPVVKGSGYERNANPEN